MLQINKPKKTVSTIPIRPQIKRLANKVHTHLISSLIGTHSSPRSALLCSSHHCYIVHNNTPRRRWSSPPHQLKNTKNKSEDITDVGILIPPSTPAIFTFFLVWILCVTAWMHALQHPGCYLTHLQPGDRETKNSEVESPSRHSQLPIQVAIWWVGKQPSWFYKYSSSQPPSPSPRDHSILHSF